MPSAKTRASTQPRVVLSPAPGAQPAGTLGTQMTVHGGTGDMGFYPVQMHQELPVFI